jgi:hypothetical protein
MVAGDDGGRLPDREAAAGHGGEGEGGGGRARGTQRGHHHAHHHGGRLHHPPRREHLIRLGHCLPRARRRLVPRLPELEMADVSRAPPPPRPAVTHPKIGFSCNKGFQLVNSPHVSVLGLTTW